jgi:hypothetical protein
VTWGGGALKQKEIKPGTTEFLRPPKGSMRIDQMKVKNLRRELTRCNK